MTEKIGKIGKLSKIQKIWEIGKIDVFKRQPSWSVTRSFHFNWNIQSYRWRLNKNENYVLLTIGISSNNASKICVCIPTGNGSRTATHSCKSARYTLSSKGGNIRMRLKTVINKLNCVVKLHIKFCFYLMLFEKPLLSLYIIFI